MKIALTAENPGLNAPMDPRFGRCPCFVVVDTDTMMVEAIDNAGQALEEGAGIQSARRLAERGVEYVLTGSCGPNARQTLAAAEINLITGCTGTVRSVVEQFVAGDLQPAGMSRASRRDRVEASADSPAAPAPPPSPVGPDARRSIRGAGGGRGGEGFGTRGPGRGRGRGRNSRR